MTKEVRISSVHAGMSYAPEFIALSMGMFEDEGLHVTVKNYGLGPWAARSIADGTAEIGMGGMWRPIMYRERLAEFQVFAQMCDRCHSNIVGRHAIEDFTLDALRGSTVMIPSGAPSQGLFLKGLLRRADFGSDDVRFIYDFVKDEAVDLYKAGLSDFMLVTSPEAEQIVASGSGVIVASLAEVGGQVPWSIYYALPSFLKDEEESAMRFARAIHRARLWAREHAAEEAEAALREHFASVPLETAIEAFRAVQARKIWEDTVELLPEPQHRWQEMLVEGGIIPRIVDYEEFYAPEPARAAVATLTRE